jgi:hypothetical protein
MMKSLAVAAALSLFALSGCAAQLERDATADAESKCAARGEGFVKDTSSAHDGLIVSSATVMGHCVPKTDPALANQQPAPH